MPIYTREWWNGFDSMPRVEQAQWYLFAEYLYELAMRRLGMNIL